MSNPAGSWLLEGFPEQAMTPDGVPPGEIQKAYEVWLETRRVSPRRAAGRLGDDDRYVAEVRGAYYVDEASLGWQLMCDFRVIEGDWSVPGRVIFVEMGYIEAPGPP